MLILCGGKMEQIAGRLRVAGAHGTVKRIFEIANADRVLRFDPDLDSACRSLAAENPQ
jgi:hypothetical protein